MNTEHVSNALKSTEELKPSLNNRVMEALNGKYRLVPVGIALVIIWLVFATLRPSFLSARNLSNLSVQIVNTAILALGLFFVLVLGEIDLSVAYQGAVAGTIAAHLTVKLGWPLIPGVIVGVLFGVVVGFIQGSIVTRFRAPAFIVTLGGQLALNGVLLLILPKEKLISLVGQDISLLTTQFVPAIISYLVVILSCLFIFGLAFLTHRQARKYEIASDFVKDVVRPSALILIGGALVVTFLGFYKGVNLAMLMMLVLLAICSYIFTQLKLGTYLFAIGGNAEAVRRAGINVNKIKLYAFMISGAIISFGGIIAASRIQGVSAASGDPDSMMNAIAAAVLGGASLSGGRGNVWGILLGSLVIGSISNGMYLIGADTSVRLIVQGAILVLAIILDSFIVNANRTRG